MTTTYDDGATAVSEDYQLYQGLEHVFAQTQSLPTTGGVKNNLGLMVLEMDLALKAFDGGDVAGAIDHHKKMLRYSRTVLGETEALTGRSAAAKAEDAKNVTADVRMLCTALMATGGIVTGDVKAEEAATQPWSKTLGAIADAYRQQQADSIAKMRILDDAEITQPKAQTPQKDIPFTFSTIAAPAFTFDGQESTAPQTTPETRWARREYKNLAIVLEGITKPNKYSPAKREAMVALACLKALNRRETEMTARARNGDDPRNGEAHQDAREYAARLQDYMTRLKKNDDVSDGAKMSLQRFGTPALTAIKGLEKSLKTPGILSRAFRFALTKGAEVLGKKAVQTLVSKPKQHVP
jgi:hypothetical protein